MPSSPPAPSSSRTRRQLFRFPRPPVSRTVPLARRLHDDSRKRLDSLRHLARNRIHDPACRPSFEIPDRLEQRGALRRQAVLDRDRTIQVDLPLRDPDLLELLQRLREGTLAHARRHAQLVEALRPGKQTVEDRELELGADHLEGDHRPAPGALAGAFLLGHDFASLHYTRGVRGISSFFSVPRFGLKPSPAWKRHARTYTSTWRYEELSSHRAPQAWRQRVPVTSHGHRVMATLLSVKNRIASRLWG